MNPLPSTSEPTQGPQGRGFFYCILTSQISGAILILVQESSIDLSSARLQARNQYITRSRTGLPD